MQASFDRNRLLRIVAGHGLALVVLSAQLKPVGERTVPLDTGLGPSAPCAKRTSKARGIFAMLAAVTTFSVMDVLLKRLSEDFPAMQVTFLRGAAAWPCVVA